jgi:hypothetical protein
MAEVKEWVELTALGVSFDSWWVWEGFSRALRDLGFHKQVICGNGHLVLGTEQERSPTLGAVVVVLFHHPRSKAYGLLGSGAPLPHL